MDIPFLALSLLPIAFLAAALSLFKVKAHWATLGAALLALALALAFFRDHLPPAQVAPVVADGVGFALYPICLVVLAALFVYSLTVESGAMGTIRAGLAGVSGDPRVLALLIVWGFGNFMEGMAGFGTAVAIPAAMLVGIGFDPLKAVLMCLVANTTPTAYGSVGVPIATLAKVGGCDANALAGTTALLQLAVTALGPFLILLVYGGRAALRGIVPLALVADAAFLVPWFLAARVLGPELPDILGGLSVLACVALVATKGRLGGNLRAQLFAWAPFGFVVALLAGAAFLPTSLKRYASPGTLVLVAGFLGGAVQGVELVAGSPVGQTIDGVTLQGSYAPMLLTGDRRYFISDNVFYLADKEMDMKGYRAYIELGAGEALVNRLLMEDEIGTSITAVEQGTERLVDVYTLGGVKLKENVRETQALDGLPHGVYVVGDGADARKLMK